MKIKPGTPLHASLDFGDRKISVGRLALDNGVALLEYSSEFIGSRLTINPFFEPPGPMLVRARQPRIFEGLHGIFADSLPDAWGEVLVRRRAEAAGIAYSSLTVLDKLAVVGTRGMGALVYRPKIARRGVVGGLDLDLLARESLALLQGGASEVIAELEQLGGSSGGARPKVLVGMNRAGEVIAGADDLPPGFEAWIVKFRSSHDPSDSGPLEAAYASMAHAAGVDMSETKLLFKGSGRGYFATRRFDRSGGSRLHVASVAGMLDTDWEVPTLDYDTLLKVTMAVTRRHPDVEKIFGRMVFNIIAHNRDDHAKQHAFLMDAAGTWRLAPAFDLTFSRGPSGEHYLAVNGKGANISLDDIMALGKRHGISKKRITEIVEMTRQAASEFERFAAECDVGAQTRRAVTKTLDAQVASMQVGSRAIKRNTVRDAKTAQSRALRS